MAFLLQLHAWSSSAEGKASGAPMPEFRAIVTGVAGTGKSFVMRLIAACCTMFAGQSNASAMISAVDSAVNTVSGTRASIGAMQNRFASATNYLSVAAENTAAANSRVADADIASSMSELVRAQILQQAGISVLAQANQSPALVLQLLR